MFLANKLKYGVKKVVIIFPKKILFFFIYIKQIFFFRKFDKRFHINFKNLYPCLSDKTTNTPFDLHYTYHPAWAARVIADIKPSKHIDISSILHFGTILSAFVPVKFYDYRPVHLRLDNYTAEFADLKKLQFSDNSVESISCMHTIEHIGLGRYGDELDVEGDLKAINELKRVLSKNGSLLFVTPVGKPKIEFNAHRIYSYEQILKYFFPLELIEFSLVTDDGNFIKNAGSEIVQKQNYGCGCFWFKK